MPWLYLLDEAQAHRDAAGVDDALFHIARAKRSDSGFFDPMGAILAVASGDESATLATLDITLAVRNFGYAVGMPGYGSVLKACKGPALSDANRLQTCAAVAEHLVQHGDTLTDLGFGAAIGKNVGWPADRIDRLRGQSAAYTHSIVDRSSDATTNRCGVIGNLLDAVRRDVRLGELGAMREWIAASGKQPEDFISEERARQSAARLKAAAAASAARAASH